MACAKCSEAVMTEAEKSAAVLRAAERHAQAYAAMVAASQAAGEAEAARAEARRQAELTRTEYGKAREALLEMAGYKEHPAWSSLWNFSG